MSRGRDLGSRRRSVRTFFWMFSWIDLSWPKVLSLEDLTSPCPERMPSSSALSAFRLSAPGPPAFVASEILSLTALYMECTREC